MHVIDADHIAIHLAYSAGEPPRRPYENVTT